MFLEGKTSLNKSIKREQARTKTRAVERRVCLQTTSPPVFVPVGDPLPRTPVSVSDIRLAQYLLFAGVYVYQEAKLPGQTVYFTHTPNHSLRGQISPLTGSLYLAK